MAKEKSNLLKMIESELPEKARYTRENHTRVVDENGEITESKDWQSGYADKEPNFVKIYLNNIMYINNLQTNTADVLHEILKEMRYDGKIVLNAYVKREIGKALDGKNLQTIDNAITKLVRKELLIRVDRGVYLANPYIFGKGKWEEIKKIRYELVMTAKGMEQKAEIEYNEEKIDPEGLAVRQMIIDKISQTEATREHS